ncbi:MAG TPA: carboxypeptidase-like regulatory domain-containing protein [Longimicrobium sp.]
MTITRLSIPLLAVSLTALAATRAAAQETALAVRVTMAETRAPLQGVQVKVDGRNAAVTDAQGAAHVAVRVGSHRVEVTAIGRRGFSDRVELAAGETRAIDVALAPEAVPLDPVTATATARSPMLQAFYDRVANHTNGRLYTRAYIERRKPQRVTDLIMDGTGLKWNQTRGAHRRLRFRRGFSGSGDRLTTNSPVTTAGFTPRDCPPKYYLNGTPLDVDHASENDPSPDLFVHIDEVEGVEVYSGNPPIQYGGLGASCGVILIWLREDAGPASPAPPSPQP